MEINYGAYIIGFICTIWILGVGCLLVDCFIKPKPVYMKVYKRPPYSKPAYKEPDDSYVIMDDDPLNMSSSIFDSMDDITDSLS